MSHIHRKSLLPFRSRSQSDPTSPIHPSFSVDRTSTIHTVFTMLDTDGCHDSKPTRSTTMPPPNTECYARNPRSIGMRKRFVNLFTSSMNRTDASTGTARDASGAPSSAGTPMRFISPRATDSVPASEPNARLRSFSFAYRQGQRKGRGSHDATDLNDHQQPMVEHDGNHVPVTDLPYQSPVRNDSVAMPSSPSKGAALTSHPVSGFNDMFSDGSEKFETPMSGRSAVFDRR